NNDEQSEFLKSRQMKLTLIKRRRWINIFLCGDLDGHRRRDDNNRRRDCVDSALPWLFRSSTLKCATKTSRESRAPTQGHEETRMGEKKKAMLFFPFVPLSVPSWAVP